jgi:uncharacterized protein YraI
MKNASICSLILTLLLTACTPTVNTPAPEIHGATTTPIVIPVMSASPTPSLPTEPSTPLPSPTAEPTGTPTAIPFIDSLDAVVTADFLSCRYGPGAEYLYLYGLKKGANIQIIGRTDGNNWVMVKGKNLCWLNAKHIEINGDPQTLKVTYPDEYKLPVSPYYAAPAILKVERSGDSVSVKWSEITLRAGDEEDDTMFIYIAEIWRCEGGKFIFDPVASNESAVTFVDSEGCTVPSHARVFFQEKHGYAGPADISIPPQ